MNRISPPKRALQFLRWFCREDYLEEVEGDLIEVFEKQYEQSPSQARRKFRWSVLGHFRPEFIKAFKIGQNSNRTAMIRHNILLTYRNYSRNKVTFFINLLGLSTGLACSILIYLWVIDELKMDKFHADDDRIFQVLEIFDEPIGLRVGETTSGGMAESLAEEMPEVEYAATVLDHIDNATLSVENKNLKVDGRHVSKDYFSIFSYPIIEGQREHIWSKSASILVSEDLALRLFGTISGVIGKSIELDHEASYHVSGVYSIPSGQSSHQFDFVLSFEEYAAQDDRVLSWGSTPAHAFVKLKPGVDVKAFNEKIADYVQKKREKTKRFRTPFLAKYSDRYLYGKYEGAVQSGGRISYVRLFSTVAIFILLIACINFMNLSTAKAARRMKEVGIKKANGASRWSLIYQYLSESTIIALFSMCIAALMVWILLPQYNEITGKHLTLAFDGNLLTSILIIVLLTGLISGSYPALYLSGFSSIAMLKGKLVAGAGETWARKGLVIFQFAISIILIVAVIVVYKQVEFVQNKHLGFEKDNIIVFDREGIPEKEDQLETFVQELKQLPGVINASSTSHQLSGHSWGVYGYHWEGKDPDDNTHFELVGVYHEMIEMLGMQMVEGRSFSRAFNAEDSKAIFNQKAIAHMGLEDPVGKSIRFWGKNYEIIGVVQDFNFESLHTTVKPSMMLFKPEFTDKFMVKIKAGREQETINSIQSFYTKYNPGFSLDYTFLDTKYQSQYVAERRVASLSKYFAGLAILISCLGLFGLAAFTAERRLKEIGIRKILGAGTFRIIYLLTGDFTKMVLVAILIALPISYFAIDQWLANFAFRIDLQWWFFAGTGLLAIFIAWFTVSLQTSKAANVNPVDCLKEE
ncbi:MAG: ABC transporter permease [Bacteroidota bacterium]